jgi:hypothetical protein
MGKNPDPGSEINIPDPQHWIIGTPSKSPLSFMGTAQRAYLSRKIERTSYVTHKFMEPGAKLKSC